MKVYLVRCKVKNQFEWKDVGVFSTLEKAQAFASKYKKIISVFNMEYDFKKLDFDME